jgi:16S rRNA C1402 (ribose-2'-O) methylase RsmI
MDEASEYLVNRTIFTARELTKVNEELVIWHKLAALREQGEFVIVVGPEIEAIRPVPEAAEVASFVGQVTEKLALSEEEALNLAMSHFGVALPKAAKLLKKGRILLKRSKDNQER